MGKKIKIPSSVLDLRMSPKKFAKKNGIQISGKGLSKKEKKRNRKRLNQEYAEFAIDGLNTAVKILVENPTHKKIDKVKDGVENIITNEDAMKRIGKMYKENPKSYTNMQYLPRMIMNTLAYYSSPSISDEEKEIGKSMNADALVEFCEKILKKQIKTYKSVGLSQEQAFQLATVIPTTRILKTRTWFKNLIEALYDIAENEEVDVGLIFKALLKEKNGIKKKDLLEGFYSEFIMRKLSNKQATYSETQKQLHETLVDQTLTYLDSLKNRKLKEILKTYIKRRKTAEEYKTDGKRVINFVEHATSNSPYTNIKAVVSELIEDNPSYELYLN